MKTTKRIITLALALVLALSLAVPAMAANETGTGTLTISGTGTTEYTLYKIFNIEKVDNGYKYQLTDEWAGFTAPGYFKVENGYAIWDKTTTSSTDAAAIAQLAKNYVTDQMTEAGTASGAGGSVELVAGYYLLVPEKGPCGVALVEANQDTPVEEKNAASGRPFVEKLVQEDADGRYEESNDVDIGQAINYQVTIIAGENADNYILHDKMDSHIEFIYDETTAATDITVTRDGNSVPMAGYYNVVENPSDGCTFHVEFTDNLCGDLAEDAKLIVRYCGELKENAAPATDHINEAWLTYTDANAVSNYDSVATRTYKIVVNKVDNSVNANPLAGAGFILRDNMNTYYKWNDTEKKVEWVAKEYATVMRTQADGVVEFVGVDAENFYLEEIEVPNGYIGTTDVPVSTKNGNLVQTVVNTLGTALPETGGIGTTVFYVAGIVLVLGALAALVVIKRKETSVQ